MAKATEGTTALCREDVRDAAQLFRLLADETRLSILALLNTHGEMHVTAICEALNQSQPAVSHHLALLRVSGLIESRRSGKHNFYSNVPGRLDGLLSPFSAPAPRPRKAVRA